MAIEVRRNAERFVTVADGRRTRHSFSFGRHYDPDNVAFGALLCHNDDLVQPGSGYPDHPHQDLEILTWVLAGTLRHRDSTGRVHEVTPGVVQRLCAGSGIVHAETNGGREPVRFVQMWVMPASAGLPPEYQLSEAAPDGGWVPLAGPGGAVPLSTPRARLSVARLRRGAGVRLPEAGRLHLFVARGTVEVEEAGVLGEGDAARAVDAGGRLVTAADRSELLLWEL